MTGLRIRLLHKLHTGGGSMKIDLPITGANVHSLGDAIRGKEKPSILGAILSQIV